MTASVRAGLAGLVLAACLGGCAGQPTSTAAAPQSASTVEVLTAAPAQPYQTLGELQDSDLPGTPASQVIARLVEKARRLGADAVIIENHSENVAGEQRFDPATGQYETSGGGVMPAFTATAIRRTP